MFDPNYHEQEVFHFIDKRWDISKAKIIANDPKHQVFDVPVETYAMACISLRGKMRPMVIAVNYDRPDWAGIDTSVPLIIASYQLNSQKRYYLIIDGHHRLAKAYEDGLKMMPAVMLSDEESDDCLM